MRVIILGCGRVGAKLAELLDAEGHEVVVIDRDPEAFRRLPPNFKGTVVVGVGIDEDVLRRAGIEQADAFIALTAGDNTNVMASQIAQHVFKVPTVISQIKDPIREETFHMLGIDTVSPTILGADKIREVMAI
jgi:trk system potassium uptake protein TrkA